MNCENMTKYLYIKEKEAQTIRDEKRLLKATRWDPLFTFKTDPYLLERPTCEEEARWMVRVIRRMNPGEEVYICCGQASPKVYNVQYPDFRSALERGVEFYVLAGPIIEIPKARKDKPMEKRFKEHTFTHFVADGFNNFHLYPSEYRQKFHYRVFRDKIVSKVAEHRFDQLSEYVEVMFNFPDEAARLKNIFRDEAAKVSKVKTIDDLTEKFIYLTGEEMKPMNLKLAKKNAEFQYLNVRELRGLYKDCFDKYTQFSKQKQ